MDLDSSVLRAFLALADELHFGRAAARLQISQQALSKRIARLEAELGAPVVDRSDRRHLRLTPLGQDVLPSARDMVEATDRIASRAVPTSRRLRVDILGDYLAPQLWSRRAARSAHLAIDVVERRPAATADHLLATGEADFAFGRAGAVPRPWPSWLRQRLVLLEPLAILAPAGHPWAACDHVTADDLAGHTLWFPLAAAPVEWRGYLAELAEAFGVAFETTGSTFGYLQWMDDIARGRVAPSIVGEAMAPTRPDAVTVPIIGPTPVYPWSLFWRDRSDGLVQELLTAMGFPSPPTHTDTDFWLPAADADLLH